MNELPMTYGFVVDLQTVCEWRFDLTGYEASIDLTYMCLGCGFTPHDCAVPGEQHSFREYDTGAAGYC